MAAYVYMLRCADGSFYIGSATGNDLSRRIAVEQSKEVGPHTDAITAERKLKG